VKKQIKTFLAGGLLALTLFGAAAAGPVEDALAAYERGDYATALQICRALADQGKRLGGQVSGDRSASPSSR
jgi:hypothetical protein